MKMGCGKRTLISLLMIAGVFQSAKAKKITVGGTTGWTLGIGPTFYDDWAKPLTFVPGDVLDFSYPGSTHNVFEVSEADLKSCNVNAPIKTYATVGGASVTLATAGTHYFICGIPGHCLLNMQISIVVSPAALPTAKAPAPAKAKAKAPGPAKKHLSPASTPGPSVTVSFNSTTATSGASTDRSVPAMIVGAVLCVVTSVLFR